MKSAQLAACAALLLLSAPALAGGRIVVAHDEFTLADSGFTNAPDTGQFARNVASWFTGGAPGHFLAYSSNFGLTGNSLAAAMTGAGHTWTVASGMPFTLANLQAYDAVFLGGNGADAAILTQYVQGGGNVYLCAGTGSSGFEASQWNPFLGAFGLQFETSYNNVGGTLPITSGHPIFQGVSALYQNNGLSMSDTAPLDPSSVVLESSPTGKHLFAIYAADGPQTYCSPKANSLGCLPRVHFAGTPSASAGSGFALTCTEAINNKNGLLFYSTHGAASAPFQGGVLCVKAPIKRTTLMNSHGNPPPADCSGSFAFDFNAFIATGQDPALVASQPVWCQFWSRDPNRPRRRASRTRSGSGSATERIRGRRTAPSDRICLNRPLRSRRTEGTALVVASRVPWSREP
jgi:hypothetical protein